MLYSCLDSRLRHLGAEGDVKALSTGALALATALSGSPATDAQTEQATVHRHNHFRHYHPPHHTLHHPMWRTAQPRRRSLECRANRLRAARPRQTRYSGHILSPERVTTMDLAAIPTIAIRAVSVATRAKQASEANAHADGWR